MRPFTQLQTEKGQSAGGFRGLMEDLDNLKKRVEGVWGEALIDRDRIRQAHHRLRSDPHFLPMSFTQAQAYQHGRALIAVKDRKAVLSREEADLQFYKKLMSNKFKDGSESDRKKPQLFLTRDSLATGNVKRVVAKYCREFGSLPLGVVTRPDHLKTRSTGVNIKEVAKMKKNTWRKNVNEFVLGRYEQIYSPKHAKSPEPAMTTFSLASARSAPTSPEPHKTVTFSTLASLFSLSPKESNPFNLQSEIRRAKRQSVDDRLKLGIGQLKSMDSVQAKNPKY